MLSKNKKGVMEGPKLIFAGFVIAFSLIIFYLWVGSNITAQAKNQAETIAAETQLDIFFSQLIKTHGIEISSGDAEQIITNYAKTAINIPKGDYSTSCSKAGLDKQCTLTVTLHETIGALITYSFFTPISAVTAPAWVLIKLIGLNEIKNTQQEAYLPVKPAQAMKFSLTTKVNFA